MATVALSLSFLAALASAEVVNFAPTPLNQLSFPKPSDAPYQVFNFNGKDEYTRGYQSGYNRCNSTTENQDSLCQTAYVNAPEDFCLWAPVKLIDIGRAEGDVVAYCNKAGHGTRRFAQGAITGMQVLVAPEAVMITGTINQPLLNIEEGDFGGELDSGGQDGRGNPIGGLIYSTYFGHDNDPTQIVDWTEFIGNNQFCIKICNPKGPNPHGTCQHTLDRIGLGYNCPSKYSVGGAQAGDFEICDSDPLPIPGIYTDGSGATQSYQQPPESLGPIPPLPYQPAAVPSKNCKKLESAALFAAVPTPNPDSTSKPNNNNQPTSKPPGSSSSPGSKPTPSGNGTEPKPDDSGAVGGINASVMSLVAGIIGVVAAVGMFA